MPYRAKARNEDGESAVFYAKTKDRLRSLASSAGMEIEFYEMREFDDQTIWHETTA